MKKIYLFALLALAFGCTDLDVEPQSTSTNEVVFSDESAYISFLAKIYAGIAVTGQQGPTGDPDIKGVDEGFSNYLRQYWQLQELTTDESTLRWGDEGLPDLHYQSWTSANQFVRATYDRIFYLITIANEFLRETTDAKLDSRNVSAGMRAEIQTFRAEARFMRALSYWHGIDLYGNIPFFDEATGIGSEAPTQSTRSEVFDFLVSELSELETLLPGPGQNQYGRADAGAVWMLQAKLYLNAEVYTGTARYADAITAVDKVIQSGAYSLNPVYQNNFTADNHISPEIIFPITFDGINTHTWGGMTYLVHASLGDTTEPTDFGVDSGWNGLRTTSALVDRFPDATGTIDSRAIFFTAGHTKEITDFFAWTSGYPVTKFRNITSEGAVGSSLVHPDTDFPMFRLADAYLKYAEAVVRGGGGSMGTALGYINELRERAYGNATGNIAMADLTLDFLLDERSRELYYEGHRRTDLVRFGQFSTTSTWPWKGNVEAGVTTDAFLDLFPIPSTELLANTNLSQNPGY